MKLVGDNNMITAKQMYEVAAAVLNQREKDDKEFKTVCAKIEDTAKFGGFQISLKPISNENVNRLRNLGFDVKPIPDNPNIPWNTEGIYISWYND